MMSFPRSPALAVWLLATAGAYDLDIAWADDGQTGKLHPWVLVAMFWGVALLSVAAHHLLQSLAPALERARHAWARRTFLWLRLRALARLYLAHATRELIAPAKRSVHQLLQGRDVREVASSLTHQGWDAIKHAWDLQMASARRAPGALIGWSRSALRTLRV